MDIPILVKGNAVYDSSGFDISTLAENQVVGPGGVVCDLEGNIIPGITVTRSPLITPPSALEADPAVLRTLIEKILREAQEREGPVQESGPAQSGPVESGPAQSGPGQSGPI
jgi:hypothetical protein